MNTHTLISVITSLFFIGGTMANPVQSWSGYKVHDTSRPNPIKIKGASCLNVPAPESATVCIGEGATHDMKLAWPMTDGVMSAAKIGDNFTNEIFSDCQVHIEFRVPKEAKVKDQKGGNSGIFLMGLYEVQIQESHTNVTYADGQAAAIYGQYPPLVNPASPQGEWQSYDITFIAPRYKEGKLISPAKITVLFNGVVVHANQEIKGPTKYRKIAKYPTAENHPQKAPHKLQWHNDVIDFRNFWVRDLAKHPYSTKK